MAGGSSVLVVVTPNTVRVGILAVVHALPLFPHKVLRYTALQVLLIMNEIQSDNALIVIQYFCVNQSFTAVF